VSLVVAEAGIETTAVSHSHRIYASTASFGVVRRQRVRSIAV